MHRTALFMSLLPLFRYAPQRKQGQIQPYRIADLTLRKSDDFNLLFTILSYVHLSPRPNDWCHSVGRGLRSRACPAESGREMERVKRNSKDLPSSPPLHARAKSWKVNHTTIHTFIPALLPRFFKYHIETWIAALVCGLQKPGAKDLVFQAYLLRLDCFFFFVKIKCLLIR